LEAWSDSEVLRDFRHEAFLRNQDPDSHFEAVYRGEGYFLSAFARIRPNSFQTVRERLPEVRFDWMPREIAETGLYHSANAAVARLKEEFAENALPGNPLYLAEFGIAGTDTDPVLSSNRFLLHYKLQRPVKINKWVNFVPLAGLQTVSYTDQEVDWSQGPTPLSTRPDDLTRVFGEIGFDLEMKAYATWDYQNKIWGIDGLRHILRPVVRYRYHFTDDDSTPSFVRIDRRAFSTSLPPIDLGNIRYVDDLGQSSVLRFGVENLLQTRDDSWGSKDLVEFNIYQDVLFTADPGEDTWTGLYTQLAVRPIHWLQVDFYSQIRPESFDLAASRARISVVNGDLWRLAVDTESLEAQVEQYRAAFSYRFNQRWSGTASLRYDSRLGKITEHAYTVHQRLANTWNLAYQLIFRSGAVREDEAQFNIRVDLVRF
jgi:LPS-assembly protein